MVLEADNPDDLDVIFNWIKNTLQVVVATDHQTKERIIWR